MHIATNFAIPVNFLIARYTRNYMIASCMYTQYYFHANDTCLERVPKNIRYITIVSLRNGSRKQKNGEVLKSVVEWCHSVFLTLDE